MSFRLAWDAQYVLDHPMMLRETVVSQRKKNCIHNSTVTFDSYSNVKDEVFIAQQFSFLVNNQEK